MGNNVEQVLVPDIGGAQNVDVIEIMVKPGDEVKADDPLITLEGEKASMDVPAPRAGKVKEIQIKVGDKVSEGSKILILEVGEAGAQAAPKTPEKAEEKVESSPPKSEAPKAPEKPAEEKASSASATSTGHIHAGPGARRIARELDLDLSQIPSSGEKGRVTKEDVQQYVKSRMQGSGGAAGFAFPPAPQIDFSKFGDIERQKLSKIKKISGANLHRNWVSIPHVTQFGDADITELENFRQREKKAMESQGVRLTPLVFIMKAVVAALRAFPHFNASLVGDELILKKYFNLGVAVDTPNGLVVPVIRDVDKKGLVELSRELQEISEKARTKGLSIADMQGGCFSISSLGGIGGSGFTPIINAPEVAILGVSRTEVKAMFINNEFRPRFMLPLSLSYDHRVIDGAEGARFIVYLAQCLSDIRTLLL